MPEVREILPYYAPGETICHGVGDKPYVIRVYLTANSYEELDEATKRLYGTVRVRAIDGADLLYNNEMTTYEAAGEKR